ncbi:MAG: outer membrane lipoprotein LolB [Arenicella sp.]|jgi:outer membrane lipoprotein LolB
MMRFRSSAKPGLRNAQLVANVQLRGLWFRGLNRLKLLHALILVASMAACASQPKIISSSQELPTSEWRSDRQYFSKVAETLLNTAFWRYTAKIGLRSNSIKESANVVWQMSDQSNNVRLFGPLGMGAVKLEFDQYGVRLSDNEGVIHQGENAQELLTDIIGWPLPIDALSRWLFLQPDLAEPFQYRLNGYGQLDAIRQFGWQINYREYREYNGRQLPRKLAAEKYFNSTEFGAVSVKLITKDWQW